MFVCPWSSPTLKSLCAYREGHSFSHDAAHIRNGSITPFTSLVPRGNITPTSGRGLATACIPVEQCLTAAFRDTFVIIVAPSGGSACARSDVYGGHWR